MASSKKKRVQSHAGTLHHFFAHDAKGASSPPRQIKSAPYAQSKSQGKQKAKYVAPPDSEVIIIDDSDDEDRREPPKRQLEDDSSDIEVVLPAASAARKKARQDGDVPQPRNIRLWEDKREGTASTSGLSISTLAVVDAGSVQVESEEYSPLGYPTLLPWSKPNPSAIETEPLASRSIQQTVSLVVPTCPPPPIQNESSSEFSMQSDDIIEIDDEWGTGDDELARGDGASDIFDLDEVEDVIDLEVPSSSKDELETCPFCGIVLKAMTALVIQKHVNGCDDSQASSTSPLARNNSSSAAGYSRGKASSNAFSVLMSSHKENEAWKEATIAEDRNFRPTKGNGGRRKAPFYKVMTGMPIAVDAFRYGSIPGVTAYFLTHAHSDHYTNLSSNWKAGPIYCSEGTANLIIHMLAVDRRWVHPLPMDVPTIIPNTGGVTVTLIEANHCPGSSLFLFEGLQTINAGDSSFTSPFVGSSRVFRYLHCGDFRASPQHTLHPAVKGKRIDVVYLDTTYLNPKYTFPAQAQVISACAELAKRLVAGQSAGVKADKGKTVDRFFPSVAKAEDKDGTKQDKILILVGTYSIGKERIVKAVAKALQTRVYCDSRKAAILRCQDDPELHAMLTKDPFAAGVHLVPLSVITSDRLKEYTERWKGHWTKAVGFRPTGWMYSPPAGADTLPPVASVLSRVPHREFTHAHLRPQRNSTPAHQLFGVPYSEHSSFFELTCFALSVDWARIIATVNVGSEASRGKIAAWVARWEAERKKRGPGVVPYRTLEYW
ncbi:DRMBL-domain-containing protein [Artomyces pyxidatus]|uniref:DRMBL-domain-containing protein n=1 Tax=Artomyces pyxidatus TaxID=48021 RepID=A0ACB8SWC1_9AGAM|nr:DRMBL-domain-containing protein [Artomyces pyxidatus]